MDTIEAELGLAIKLRQGTAIAHRDAESAAFIKQFFKGQLNQDEYASFLASLYPVYAAMEAWLDDNPDHPHLRAFHLPAMFRCAALEEDLAYFMGSDWRASVGVRPGSRAYAERIVEVGANEPVLLVAHIYTRYLGDLSGGQIMGRVAQKALGLDDDGGLAFYGFDEIEDVEVFKDAFRAKLNALAVDRSTEGRIVDEAVRSFHLNHELTHEVTQAV